MPLASMQSRHHDVSSPKHDRDTVVTSFNGELLNSNENIPLLIESSMYEEYDDVIRQRGSSNVLLDHFFDELSPLEKLPHEFDIDLMGIEPKENNDPGIKKASSDVDISIVHSPNTNTLLDACPSLITSQSTPSCSPYTTDKNLSFPKQEDTSPLCKELVSNIDSEIAIELSDTERPLKDRDKLIEELRIKYKNISPIVLITDFRKTTIRNKNDSLNLREIPRKNYAGMVSDDDDFNLSEGEISNPSTLVESKNNLIKCISISSDEEDDCVEANTEVYDRTFMSIFTENSQIKQDESCPSVDTQSDTSTASQNKLQRKNTKYNLDLLSDKDLCSTTSDDTVQVTKRNAKDHSNQIQTPAKHKVLIKKKKKTKNHLFFPAEDKEEVKIIKKTKKSTKKTQNKIKSSMAEARSSKSISHSSNKETSLKDDKLISNTSLSSKIADTQSVIDSEANPSIPPIPCKKETPTTTISDETFSDETTLHCVICKVSFKSGKELQDHHLVCLDITSISKLELNKYACEKCSFCYSTKDDLKNHQAYHLAFNMMCKVCGLTFHTLFAFDNHRKTHLEEVILTLISEDSKSYKISIRECSFCGIGFCSALALSEHLRSCPKRPFKTTPTPTNQIVDNAVDCAACNVKFPSHADLIQHNQYHQGTHKFLCRICNRSYQSNPGRLKHEQLEHGSLPLLHCDACGKQFKRKDRLKDHIATKHSVATPHKCPYCDGAFKLRDYLRKHVNQFHPGKTLSLPANMTLKTDFKKEYHIRTDGESTGSENHEHELHVHEVVGLADVVVGKFSDDTNDSSPHHHDVVEHDHVVDHEKTALTLTNISIKSDREETVTTADYNHLQASLTNTMSVVEVQENELNDTEMVDAEGEVHIIIDTGANGGGE